MMQNRRFSTVGRRSTGSYPAFPASRARLAHEGQQSLARQPQVGHGKQRHDLPSVLLESAIADLGESELALHDTEGIFDDGPYRRQHPVEGFLFIGQCAAGRLLGRCQDGKASFLLEALEGPVRLVIAPITQGNFLFAVQAGVHHRDVGDCGGRAFDAMDQAALGIDANMGFHAEVPLVALLGLRHLGVALLVLVLGRTRGGDQRRIDDRAALHGQTLLGKHAGHFSEDGGGQIVLFQQMAEAQDGAFVGHDVFGGIQPGKLTQQGNVVQGFFHRRVGVTKPLLHEANAQHRAQLHRRAAVAFLGVERLNQGFKTRPRLHRVHLRQEYRLPGLLARFRQKSRFGQAQLLQRFHQFSQRHDNGAIFSNQAT